MRNIRDLHFLLFQICAFTNSNIFGQTDHKIQNQNNMKELTVSKGSRDKYEGLIRGCPFLFQFLLQVPLNAFCLVPNNVVLTDGK